MNLLGMNANQLVHMSGFFPFTYFNFFTFFHLFSRCFSLFFLARSREYSDDDEYSESGCMRHM